VAVNNKQAVNLFHSHFTGSILKGHDLHYIKPSTNILLYVILSYLQPKHCLHQQT